MLMFVSPLGGNRDHHHLGMKSVGFHGFREFVIPKWNLWISDKWGTTAWLTPKVFFCPNITQSSPNIVGLFFAFTTWAKNMFALRISNMAGWKIPKSIYPLVNIQKTMVLWNITMLSMDKSTIFMGLFQWQTVSLPEGILYIYPWFIHGCWLCSIIFHYWPLLTIGISIYGWFPRSSSSAIPSEPAAAQKLQWLRCQQRWRQRQRRVCRRQREV